VASRVLKEPRLRKTRGSPLLLQTLVRALCAHRLIAAVTENASMGRATAILALVLLVLVV